MSQFANEIDRDRHKELEIDPLLQTAVGTQRSRLPLGTGPMTGRQYVQMREAQFQQRRRFAAEGLKRSASLGVSDATPGLPHGDQIQQSFGKHNIADVQSVIGGKAQTATEQMGAEAYATGNKIAFKQQPGLHTAAHEAAHVIQQRAGVQLKSGIGQQGDAYERHADQVADLVVQGKSAESLLNRFAPQAPKRGVQFKKTTVDSKTEKKAAKPFGKARSAFFKKFSDKELSVGQKLSSITRESVQQFVQTGVGNSQEYRILKKEFRSFAKHIQGGNLLKSLEKTPPFATILLKKKLLRTSSELVAAIRRIGSSGESDGETLRVLARLGRHKSRAVREAVNEAGLLVNANASDANKKKLNTLAAENKRLRSENTTLKSQHTTLKSENTTLKSQHTTLKSENTTLKSRLTRLESRIERLEGKQTDDRNKLKTIETRQQGIVGQVHKNAILGAKNEQNSKKNALNGKDLDQKRLQSLALAAIGRAANKLGIAANAAVSDGRNAEVLKRLAKIDAKLMPKGMTVLEIINSAVEIVLPLAGAIFKGAKLVSKVDAIQKKLGKRADQVSVAKDSLSSTLKTAKLSQKKKPATTPASSIDPTAAFRNKITQRRQTIESRAKARVVKLLADKGDHYRSKGEDALAADALKALLGSDLAACIDPTTANLLDAAKVQSLIAGTLHIALKRAEGMIQTQHGVSTKPQRNSNEHFISRDQITLSKTLQNQWGISPDGTDLVDPRPGEINPDQIERPGPGSDQPISHLLKVQETEQRFRKAAQQRIHYRSELALINHRLKFGVVSKDEAWRLKKKLFVEHGGERHHQTTVGNHDLGKFIVDPQRRAELQKLKEETSK